MSTKVACVIQGNIRSGTDLILRELRKHVKKVILSTWEDEKDKLVPGDYEVIYNKKPINPGYSNRNYQRISTYAGVKAAEGLSCTHVLKWRTDMLPTKLDINVLLRWADYKVPDGLSSRLVTCAFRNLTVKDDYFSSIPDLFHFSDIDTIKMLWNTDGFDFSKNYNMPEEMNRDCGNILDGVDNIEGVFCSESELYAHFKCRLQEKLKIRLNHEYIAKNIMYLFNHNRLGIIWFSNNGSYRSIDQALQHPWWSECTWRYFHPYLCDVGYKEDRFKQKILRAITPYIIRGSVKKQKKWYEEYLRRIKKENATHQEVV